MNKEIVKIKKSEVEPLIIAFEEASKMYLKYYKDLREITVKHTKDPNGLGLIFMPEFNGGGFDIRLYMDPTYVN